MKTVKMRIVSGVMMAATIALGQVAHAGSYGIADNSFYPIASESFYDEGPDWFRRTEPGSSSVGVSRNGGQTPYGVGVNNQQGYGFSWTWVDDPQDPNDEPYPIYLWKDSYVITYAAAATSEQPAGQTNFPTARGFAELELSPVAPLANEVIASHNENLDRWLSLYALHWDRNPTVGGATVEVLPDVFTSANANPGQAANNTASGQSFALLDGQGDGYSLEPPPNGP